MTAVTLTLAGFGVILVLLLKPAKALSAYAVILISYPYSLTVPVGTIDFSVGRIIIIALYFKIFFMTKLVKQFKINWMDRFVIFFFVGQIIAGLTTTETMMLIENRAGDFFDMALPYFAVRLIITDKKSMLTLLKAVAAAGAILALFAFYESVTGNNILHFGRSLAAHEKRMGLNRAQATFRHPIYMGVFFGMVGTACFGLMRNVKNPLYVLAACLLYLGAFSSMSSGGLMAMAVGLLFLFAFKMRFRWKETLLAVLLMCLIVEFWSNRHFYDVIDRFTFNAQTAWYRTRLFEVAFFEGGMKGHWLCGFGFEDPMWGLLIDTRKHTDMVNHYLLILCRNGLLGFIPFLVIVYMSVKNLFTGFFKRSKRDQWMIWCLAGALFSVFLTMNSVSLFGQPTTYLFMLFGLSLLPLKMLPETNMPSAGNSYKIKRKKRIINNSKFACK